MSTPSQIRYLSETLSILCWLSRSLDQLVEVANKDCCWGAPHRRGHTQLIPQNDIEGFLLMIFELVRRKPWMKSNTRTGWIFCSSRHICRMLWAHNRQLEKYLCYLDMVLLAINLKLFLVNDIWRALYLFNLTVWLIIDGNQASLKHFLWKSFDLWNASRYALPILYMLSNITTPDNKGYTGTPRIALSFSLGLLPNLETRRFTCLWFPL